MQVGLGQEVSSLPSKQSASSSHRKEEEMHWPFAQRNSSDVQFFGAEKKEVRDESTGIEG